MIYVDKNMLLGHLKSTSNKQKIHIINLGKFELGCVMFPKNSPLVPILNQGARYLRENGLERQLYNKWIGEYLDVSTSEGDVITLGQMVAAFAMMLVVCGVALMLLCGELAYKSLNHTIISALFLNI